MPGEEAWLVGAEATLKQLAAAIKARWICEQAHQQWIQKVLDVGVQNPVHLPLIDRHAQGLQRIVRPSPGPKPVNRRSRLLRWR